MRKLLADRPLTNGRFVAVVLAAAGAAAAQETGPGLPDPFRLLEPKDFVAGRASSNNPDPRSNDDSQRPIPGETIVLADLEGPGIVTHIWLTVAASEYGWPRLLRLRVYYDGSRDAERRRAARRLLRGGPRLRAAGRAR